MKEFYTSPEAELLKFAPAENLMTGDIELSFENDDEFDGEA